MDYQVRRSCVLVASALLPILAAAASAATGAGMFGFTPEQAGAQQTLESRFDAELNAGEMRGWLKTLSSEPNQWDVANDYIGVTAAALSGYCDRLDRATRVLKGS